MKKLILTLTVFSHSINVCLILHGQLIELKIEWNRKK